MKYTQIIILVFLSISGFSQTKSFLDVPYIETSAIADTLIVPDKIFLTIIIAEKDSKGKVSVEELQDKMLSLLQSYGIDTKKQLSMNDITSNFRKYFLRQQDVLKAKEFELLVRDAKTAGKIVIGLEQIGISNISLSRTEYSKESELKLFLKTKAIIKARAQAEAMATAANRKVGEAILISDLTNDVLNSLSGKVSGIVVTGYSGKSKYEEPEIEIQKVEVSAQVSIKYKMQ
jgi:hypothetical protein